MESLMPYVTFKTYVNLKAIDTKLYYSKLLVTLVYEEKKNVNFSNISIFLEAFAKTKC